MNSARGAWALAIALCATTAACGGSKFEDLGDSGAGGGSDGGGGDSGNGGGDSGGGSPVCPASVPKAGDACSHENLQCEYGNDPNPSCNEIAQCVNGHWALEPHQTCPTPTTCPSSYSDVPVNQKCSPNGEACPYVQGTCYCSQGGGPISQDPHWICVPAPSGCPSARPDLGSACSQSGLSCDYGACVGGAAVQCKDGYWQRVFTPCPV